MTIRVAPFARRIGVADDPKGLKRLGCWGEGADLGASEAVLGVVRRAIELIVDRGLS